MKTKLKITSSKGRLMCQYQGQSLPQDRYIEVEASGELYITYNPEIGNAVSGRIFNGKTIRIHGHWATKSQARNFILDNKDKFLRLISGMDERYDGNNYVGTLTEDARASEDELDYAANEYYA